MWNDPPRLLSIGRIPALVAVLATLMDVFGAPHTIIFFTVIVIVLLGVLIPRMRKDQGETAKEALTPQVLVPTTSQPHDLHEEPIEQPKIPVAR